MIKLPTVSLGEFRIGNIDVALRASPNRHAIEVAITLDSVRDVRSGRETTLTKLEHVDAYAWELMAPAHRRVIIRDLVLDVVEHEIDEHLRIDGEQVVDPHEGEITPVTISGTKNAQWGCPNDHR